MKCGKCGNIVTEKDVFCGKCGAPAITFLKDEVKTADGIELPSEENEQYVPPISTDEYEMPASPPAADYAPMYNQPPYSEQPTVMVQNPVNEQPVVQYAPQMPMYNQPPVAPMPNNYPNKGGKGKKAILFAIIAVVLIAAILLGIFFILPMFGIKFFEKSEANIDDVSKIVDYSGLIATVDGYNYRGNIDIAFDDNGQLCVMGDRNFAFSNAKDGTIESFSNSNGLESLNYDKNLVNYFAASNGDEIAEQYADHLSDVWGGAVTYLCEDVDEDGRMEYVYFIRGFAENWNTESGGFWLESLIEESYYRGQVCIYADVDDNGILFNTFYIFDGKDASYYVNYHNGTLTVSLSRSVDAEKARFFCARVEDAKENYSANDSELKNLCNSYAKHLVLESPYRVGVKLVDICDVPGREAIIVLSDGNGTLVYAEAFYYGRPITLYYDKGEVGCAIYLVNNNGKYCLMEYYQSTYNSGGIKTAYSYEFVDFDDSFEMNRYGRQQIELWDSKVPTSADNEFFAKLNGYLDNSLVCSDPYELTGYSFMPGLSTDFNQSQDGKYLNITNCNTNKIGRVAVNWDSWLNLRRGPSVKDDKVLLYSYDKKSFIKQMNGSSVTIIDTVNTGDKKNPIWVEIQIKYAGMTLTGYSSQTYIDIPNIKHLSVGQSFTVQASTNDSGLYWYSNDSSVLSIDSSTGLATARAKGLVMVEVTSTSGLTDSCLIMVD